MHYCPDSPTILVGTKLDLREDHKIVSGLMSKGKSPVTTEEGLELSREIGAACHQECSAYSKTGVKQLFDTAVRVVFNPELYSNFKSSHKRKSCAIL